MGALLRLETYQVEAQVERRHWWFRGRRRILDRLVTALGLPAGAAVLDVGCGTGANGPVLARHGALVVGVDASTVPLALQGQAGRGHSARLRADALALPFRDASFDLVVALDVLEHLVDHAAAAHEIARVLRPRGSAVVFVPALRLLWGLQDEVSHHRRRYRSAELAAALEAGGLRVERLTYFNLLLFAPILTARLAMRLWRPRGLRSENQVGGRLANAALGALFALEAPLVERVDLPLGVSLAAVARRR